MLFHRLHHTNDQLPQWLMVAIAFFSYCNASFAAADTSLAKQSINSIRTTAEEFVRESVKQQLGLSDSKNNHSGPVTIEKSVTEPAESEAIVTVGELDSRLQLPQCAEPLQAFVLNNSALAARNTIGVRCRHNAEWTVYLQVSVDSTMNVLVLSHPVNRDAQLVASDVDRQRRRVTGFSSQYVSDVAKLADYRVKRTLPAGVILTTEMLRRDAVIRRGQQVTLITTLAGIDVRATGVALSEGGNADRIRVQNTTSLKIVEGVVETSNTVRVGM
jgi:flagellar basal body P-ring formation protein FlgA